MMSELQTATTAAKYQNVSLEAEGPIAIVTLSRPQRRNAL
jgi:enoyl-CoA hydratase/carnithine racemase